MAETSTFSGKKGKLASTSEGGLKSKLINKNREEAMNNELEHGGSHRYN